MQCVADEGRKGVDTLETEVVKALNEMDEELRGEVRMNMQHATNITEAINAELSTLHTHSKATHVDVERQTSLIQDELGGYAC